MTRAVLFAFVCCAGVLLCAASARAQLSMVAAASSDRVEVGEPFQVELSASTTEGAEITDPRLTAPPGFKISGPQIGSQQRISFENGRLERQQGITATWTLVASKVGSYSIGPPSVVVGGKRVGTNQVSVEVVPEGSRPRAPTRRRRGLFDDPFDPFGMLRGLRIPRDDPSMDPFAGRVPNIPEEYRTEHAPDAVAFLRAEVTPSRVYLGQQTTLRIYAYDARGPFEETSTSEPSRVDFLSQVIIRDAHREPMYRVLVDERLYHVVKVREVALFPLKTGRLEIGAMTFGFRRPGAALTDPRAIVVRKSTPLSVQVVETPEAGRPPGFVPGNVGQFTLSATVDPREVRAGEAVSAVVTLEGSGNLPSEVAVPARRGVTFDKPRVTEQLSTRGGTFGGERKFSYVVRLDEPGRVDLGDVTLVYFDPSAGRYATARAALGTVEVAPGAVLPAPASAEPQDDKSRLTRWLVARPTLGAPAKRPLHLADRPWFWVLLAGGPLGVLGVAGSLRAGAAFTRRRRTQKHSSSARIRDALSEAEEAAKRGDVSATASAVERSLYLVIEEQTELRARGVLRSKLKDELSGRGVPAELAEQAVQLLSRCEEARFARDAHDAAELRRVGSDLVARLRRASPREPARA